MPGAGGDYDWIDDQVGLDQLIDTLLGQPRYAFDTEFHRERTYFPRLALAQFAWDGGIALVDPLAVDVTALQRLLHSDVVAVLHAAQQDLDVLQHACGAVPRRLFDTQLASGFTGYGTPSLSSLVHGELHIAVPKGDRLTDWLRRPLTADQRSYAASDVAYLLELTDRLNERLERDGRFAWAEAACEELRTRPVGGADPDSAWLRIKDVRTLKPRARGVARSVAAWRERRAMAVDTPVRHILPDLAILGIAQRQPRTVEDLAHARGVDERHWRGALGKEIIAAVAEGAGHELQMPIGDSDELDRHLRPAVTLVLAWVSELARQEHIDTALLATKNDIVALLRRDPDSRLASGWRAEMLGDNVTRLVEGRAGLTFDGRGGLRLIDVPAS
ncbi:MAG TPA: HRDC domain-containing protein [Ilumatobacteraceae bacterium]|nr:HRDC domain-containing protein [Ilumatobacteraceae bacterium]